MRALRCGALVLALLVVGCSSDDDEPEVAGVEIERDETSSTTTSSTSTSTSTSSSTTSTTVAPGGSTTTTTAAPRSTPPTVARSAPTTTTTIAAPPPPPSVPAQQPGSVQGVLSMTDGSRGRLFLIDTNGAAVVGSDELPSSGEFSFGQVAPGDYRVDTSTTAADGSVREDRGIPFQVGQAAAVRLVCDPRCAPA